MTSATHETGDMMVITCRVPSPDLERLSLEVVDHTVSVAGPGGFRHKLTLPPEADMNRLDVDLYRGILELRAPASTG